MQIDMLEGARHAIVVANAQPDLLTWFHGKARGRQGAKKILHTQGERAWGILEGLEKMGFCQV